MFMRSIKHFVMPTFLLVGITVNAWSAEKTPMVKIYDSNREDTVAIKYSNVSKYIYDNNCFIDFPAETQKFLRDEGLKRYQRFQDEAMIRAGSLASG